MSTANTIIIGKDTFSAINPPPHEYLKDATGRTWKIGHGQYGIVLQDNGECHPDFVNGMGMIDFLWWVNSQAQ